MVLKLGDPYRDVLRYRISKSEISLVPLLLRVIPVLRLNSSSRHHSDIGWPMLLVGLCRLFVLSRSLANRAKQGISDIYFFFSLKSCSSIRFHSDFFRSSCLIRSVFSENWVVNFARYCLAPRKDFIFLDDIGQYNCNIAFIFSFFRFIPYSVISYPSQLVSSRKISGFFLLALYPASWICFNFMKSVSRCLSLSPLVTVIISSSHTDV